jgi:hypothetical protein
MEGPICQMQVGAQVGADHLRKWEGLRPMTTGPPDHMAHSSLTWKQKCLVRKELL